MHGIEIIEAGAERLDEVEPIWKQLSEHHADLTPDAVPARPPDEGWPIRRRRYEADLRDGAVLFLATRGSEAVGYAFATPRGPKATLAIDRLLEIDTIAVVPEARGAGTGGELMAAVESWANANGIEHLEVAVRDANDGARRLYERHGFKPLYTTMVATRPRGPDTWGQFGQDVTFPPGSVLELKRYRTHRAGWDHDHCIFCWATFMDPELSEPARAAVENDDRILTSGFTIGPPGGEWVCPSCFAEFSERFGWTSDTAADE